jgi:hypothetical protein
MADNLTAICEPSVKCGSLDVSESSGPPLLVKEVAYFQYMAQKPHIGYLIERTEVFFRNVYMLSMLPQMHLPLFVSAYRF